MRVLTIISGVLLVLTGVFCFANPGETFLSLAFILGFMMVINSIIQGIAYWWGRSGKKADNNGWILAESIITFILGVLVLSSQIAADVAIPMVFGLWVMFSGALRIVAATIIDMVNKRANFVWTLVTGVICVAGGLYAFLNPIIAGLAIAVLLGIIFLLQGISTLELGIHMPHEKKEKKPEQPRKPKTEKQPKPKKQKRPEAPKPPKSMQAPQQQAKQAKQPLKAEKAPEAKPKLMPSDRERKAPAKNTKKSEKNIRKQ